MLFIVRYQFSREIPSYFSFHISYEQIAPGPLTMNLQLKQKELLGKMLTNLESDPTNTSFFSSESSWKVLVYDGFCRDILAPLFSVGELKKMGVTLHLMLHSKRERIRDVPVVYFVRPTTENLERILEDLKTSIYDRVFLNFTSLPSDRLEWLAERVAALPIDPASVIMKVMDRHTDFVSLDKFLYSLNHKHSYASVFGRQLPDTMIQSYLVRTASSLFSLIVTLGAIPIIRAPAQAGPAHVAAQLLSQLIRAQLPQLSALTALDASSLSQRPLLLMLDRNFDVAAPLHHPLAYVALIDDMLGFQGNRVSVPDPAKPGTVTAQEIDVSESFWNVNAHKSLPDVAEAVTTALAQYKTELATIEAQQAGGDPMHASALSSVISSIPALTRRKKQLDLHTNIGMSLVEKVRDRQCDEYHAAEEAAMEAHADIAMIRTLVTTGKGTLADKLRTVLVCAFTDACDDNLFAELTASIEQQAAAATSPNGDTAPGKGSLSVTEVKSILSYTRALRHDRRLASVMGGDKAGLAANGGRGPAAQTAQGQSMFARLATSVMSHSANVLTTLASLGQNESPLAVVRAAARHIANGENAMQGFIQIDPTAAMSTQSVAASQPNRHVIVTMVGGGCYAEYAALRQLGESGVSGVVGRIEIGYCASEMLNADSALKEWALLGGEGDAVKNIVLEANKE